MFREKKGSEKYVLLVDDRYTKICMENVLKQVGTTLDYTINPDKVEVDNDALHYLLKSCSPGLEKKLKSKENQNKFKNILINLADKYLPASEIIEVFQTVFA